MSTVFLSSSVGTPIWSARSSIVSALSSQPSATGSEEPVKSASKAFSRLSASNTNHAVPGMGRWFHSPPNCMTP